MLACEECDRLWNEYRNTTHRYFRLKSKLNIARLSGDRQSEEKAARLLHELSSFITTMRQQISAHKAEAHAGTGAAAADR